MNLQTFWEESKIRATWPVLSLDSEKRVLLGVKLWCWHKSLRTEYREIPYMWRPICVSRHPTCDMCLSTHVVTRTHVYHVCWCWQLCFYWRDLTDWKKLQFCPVLGHEGPSGVEESRKDREHCSFPSSDRVTSKSRVQQPVLPA